MTDAEVKDVNDQTEVTLNRFWDFEMKREFLNQFYSISSKT